MQRDKTLRACSEAGSFGLPVGRGALGWVAKPGWTVTSTRHGSTQHQSLVYMAIRPFMLFSRLERWPLMLLTIESMALNWRV